MAAYLGCELESNRNSMASVVVLTSRPHVLFGPVMFEARRALSNKIRLSHAMIVIFVRSSVIVVIVSSLRCRVVVEGNLMGLRSDSVHGRHATGRSGVYARQKVELSLSGVHQAPQVLAFESHLV